MGASCLSNGHKYYPNFRSHWGTRGQLRGKKRNRWYRFFDEIGLRAFSPVAGCSELITSKIVHRNNLSSEVLFCESSDGRPCYKCTKCFRKMLGLGYSGYSIQKKSWEDYDEREIIDFLKKRPGGVPGLNISPTNEGGDKLNCFSLLYRKLLHQLLLCQFLVFQLLYLFLIQ